MDILSKLGYGGIVAVIGLLIVFTGLVILIFCVWLMGNVFRKIEQKKKAAAAPAAAPAPVEVAPAPVAEIEEAPAEDDAQLIAVIAAALAAYDDGNKRLVIRNVRRIGGWNGAARREQVYKF